MKTRKTQESKVKVTLIRTTEEEHSIIKMKAAKMGITMSKMIIDALKDHLKIN
jgi:predicted HicB family RNase H-like nuclease